MHHPQFTSPFTELRTLEQVIARQNYARSQAARFTPVSAANYAQYARMYPWMPPGVSRAAAMSNIPPNDPDMVRLSHASLAEGMDSGRLNQGSRIRPDSLNPGPIRSHLPVEDQQALQEAENWPLPASQSDAARSLGFIDEQNNFVRPTPPSFDIWDKGVPRFKHANPEDKARDDQFFNMMRMASDMKGVLKPAGKLIPIPFLQHGQWYQYHPRTGKTEPINRQETLPTDVRTALEQGRIKQPIGQSAGAQEVEQQVSGIPGVGPAYKGGMAVLRTAGVIANYPTQELNSAARNIKIAVKGVQEHGYGYLLHRPPEEMQFAGESTDAGIAAERLLHGQPVDLGSGFFIDPMSDVAIERRRREAQAGKIGKHNISIGRLYADVFTTPDTEPFDVLSGVVDLGVQLADPTAFALGQAGKAKQAAKLFEAESIKDPYAAAGLLGSISRKPSIDTNLLSKRLDSTQGMAAVEELTKTKSAYRVGQLLNNYSLEFKHDPAIYDDIARTASTPETRAVLTDLVQTGKIREVADLSKSWGHGLTQAIKPRFARSKYLDKMPGFYAQLTDPKDTINQVMRGLRNASAPESMMEESFNKLAATRNKFGRREAITDISNHVLDHLDVDPELASELTRLYHDTFYEIWRGVVDEQGVRVPTWEKHLANGEVEMVAGPHAIMEMVEDTMPLWDTRAIRNLTSKFPNLTQKLPEGGVKYALQLPPAAIDYFMQEIWKPLQLLRGAWLIRVLGEGQIRIASSGLDSLFSGHPLEAVGFMMSQPRFGIKSRGAATLSDELWPQVQEYERALSSIHSWAYRPGASESITTPTLIERSVHTAKMYRRAWGKELAKFNHDPVYSKWLQSDTTEEFRDWFTKGEGRGFLKDIKSNWPGNLETPNQIERYINDIDERFSMFTNNNSDLYNILRSGNYTDVNGVTKSIFRKNAKPELTPAFEQHLAKYMDDGPPKIWAKPMPKFRGKSDYLSLKRYAIQNWLYGAMSKSENFLDRGPVMKQAYWTKELPELIQFADPLTAQKLIAQAEKYNIPSRYIERMRMLARTKVPGRMNMDEIELVAKGRAMDRAQKLLYSYSERRQIFDVLRNFFPFGDAWYEVMSQWTKIMRETMGKPARRLQQVIEGSINNGFFYENQYGDLSFTWPFSQAVNIGVTGEPVALESRVKGLNMFGEIMPGVGPVVQVPLAWFMEGKPQLQDIEKAVLPFGAPSGEQALTWKNIMPRWMQSGLSAVGIRTADERRSYENLVSTIADIKMSRGGYGNSPAELARLLQESRHDANKIYGIQVLGQFWLPSSPHLKFYADDKEGKNIAVTAMSKEFHDYLEVEHLDYDQAIAKFIDNYGEDAIGNVIANSTASVYGLPDSKEAQAWVDSHSSVKSNYPMTYGLFAPQGEFDPTVFFSHFATGELQSIPAQKHIQMINDYLNRYWQNKAMGEMGVTSYNQMDQTQKNIWDDITDAIDKQYPSARYGLVEKPQVKDMIDELTRAVDDKTIKNTPAGPALKLYLDARDQAQDAVEQLRESGVISSSTKGYQKAKSVSPIREWLRSEAQDLIDEYPAFQPLWTFVFSRELAKD